MRSEKIKATHLSRIAYVYIRQSTQHQVEHNLESQSRQYQLVDKAKAMGFRDVSVIDEDLGSSGSIGSERSGFKRLVAEVTLNKVGMVLGIEVSRFARNNRDWYHLLDLCSLFDTLIADQDGIYHPADANDRMILGLKGTMSEVEVNLLKSRMLEGARNKAKRGELVYRLPVGYLKTDDQRIEKDPDLRIQKVITQVFSKFRESRSIRQTFLWFIEEGIDFPAVEYGRFGREVIWRRPVYNTIHNVLTNAVYAGAYVYGRREKKNRFDGETIKKRRYDLEMKDWKVLIKDHHPGYISWDEFEENLGIIQGNAKMMGESSRGPILRGESLLAGLLRCRRCGRKLSVAYSGKSGKVPQYACKTSRLMRGERDCVYFGGMRVDDAVSKEVLRVVEPLAIEASLKSIDEWNLRIDDRKKLIELELKNAEYEAERAYRQYNRVEPENRLVCAQLEVKWNSCLEKIEETKSKLQALAIDRQPLTDAQRQQLIHLVRDLPELWNSESTTNEMRKRVIRTVIEEIICDTDSERPLICLDIHWVGGIHTRLEVKKNRTGQHNATTEESTVELIRQLAEQLPDKAIAPVLNRLGIKTGKGNNWTRDRVRTLRSYYGIPSFTGSSETEVLTMEQAAERLKICPQSVRKLIGQKLIEAKQIVPFAPWMIPCEELDKQAVKDAAERIRNRLDRRNQYSRCENQLKLFE